MKELKGLAKIFKIPIAVGFGISSKERMKLIEPYTDIVVVGSAIIDAINQSSENKLEQNIREFLKLLNSRNLS